jgi:hypothetical protein
VTLKLQLNIAREDNLVPELPTDEERKEHKAGGPDLATYH